MASKRNPHASKHEQKERMIRWYVEETGDVDIDMEKVAKWAVGKGHPLPAPVSPIERLAKDFARAAREVHERDAKSGKPYRKYHAIMQGSGPGQTSIWVDIDNPKTTRNKMHKSLMQRRDQVIGDVVQLALDSAHWNTSRPAEEPIHVPTDYTPDVEWRLNAPDEDGEKKAG
jgi:hypothetical protein